MDNFIIKIKKIAISSLKKAHIRHDDLGATGLEPISKNQFGDMTLLGDWEMEETVIKELKDEGFPARIKTEEHGIIDLVENPLYLVLADGIDGTGLYKKGRGKERYGTMIGIFSSLDPTYDDYIFSGIMQHATNKLFFATKGGGSFVSEGKKERPLSCSKKTELDKETRIYIDEAYEINKEVFSKKLQGFNVINTGSMARAYADLVSGDAGLSLFCAARKEDLEMMTAYGLLKEAGGVMITLDGNDLAGKKYLELSQVKYYVPIVAAANRELAENLLKK
jgi:fructose-1,6-bisphosphatase/inositol monophosphatase family enzyme